PRSPIRALVGGSLDHFVIIAPISSYGQALHCIPSRRADKSTSFRCAARITPSKCRSRSSSLSAPPRWKGGIVDLGAAFHVRPPPFFAPSASRQLRPRHHAAIHDRRH